MIFVPPKMNFRNSRRRNSFSRRVGQLWLRHHFNQELGAKLWSEDDLGQIGSARKWNIACQLKNPFSRKPYWIFLPPHWAAAAQSAQKWPHDRKKITPELFRRRRPIGAELSGDLKSILSPPRSAG
jgi:hypothetical protein